MERTITITRNQLEALFERWLLEHERNPGPEAYPTPTSYGVQCADYFEDIHAALS